MKTESPPSAFDSAAVVCAQPGDVILFRCAQQLTDTQRDKVLAMLNEVFPDHESVILDGGMDIAVLRPAQGLLARLFRPFRSVARGA